MKIVKLNESKEAQELETAERLQDSVAEELLESDDPTVRETDGGATTEVDVAMTSKDATAVPTTRKEAIKIRNALTDKLDQAFDDAKYALEEENFDANCNVLVTGLPGSSKTATIRNW
jgi:hypothetical protein